MCMARWQPLTFFNVLAVEVYEGTVDIKDVAPHALLVI